MKTSEPIYIDTNAVPLSDGRLMSFKSYGRELAYKDAYGTWHIVGGAAGLRAVAQYTRAVAEQHAPGDVVMITDDIRRP